MRLLVQESEPAAEGGDAHIVDHLPLFRSAGALAEGEELDRWERAVEDERVVRLLPRERVV